MERIIHRWKVAAVQMTSTQDRRLNLQIAGKLARKAAKAGARLIAFPENFTYLHSEGRTIPFADTLRSEVPRQIAAWAGELGVYILAGSIPEKIQGSSRVYNTSLLFGPDGKLLARYRKIHLFDIAIPGRVSLKESRTIAPGNRPVAVNTPLGRLGLSICYDLRFPELYRILAARGAQVIFVPSAFTAYTGKYHWMVLLRARAIENQCWVVAPAQVGRHSRKRQSHGETVVIDPWGEIVAVRKKGQGIVMAEIDLDRVRRVRTGLPALDHIRLKIPR